jgi:hypothetical protein
MLDYSWRDKRSSLLQYCVVGWRKTLQLITEANYKKSFAKLWQQLIYQNMAFNEMALHLINSHCRYTVVLCLLFKRQ